MKFIHRFSDILLESNISLLLEGKLMASDNFLEKIAHICEMSDPPNKIAEFLYAIFDDDQDQIEKDLPQNIVDLSSKEDSITFISDKSYNKAISIDPNLNPFSMKGRSETKIGRFVRSLSNELGEKFTDKEIEDFVNLYKSSSNSDDKFKIVTGEDIKRFYLEENYESKRGTLGDSCMRYEECQEYLEIYSFNEDVCSLLVLLNGDEEVLGRALIWKIHSLKMDSPCDAKYIMDRIYTAHDSDVQKFKNYASSKGFMFRKNMSNHEDGSCFVFTYKKKNYTGEIQIKLGSYDFSEYPYIDTFSFLNNNILSNVGSIGCSILDDTEGSSSECGNCEGTGISSDNTCETCHGKGNLKCQNCKCDKCNNGKISCNSCEGSGEIDCDVCEGNCLILCPCNAISKDGIVSKCEKCKGKAFTCKICNGEGTYLRKWGMGKRKVNCGDCSGQGKILPFALGGSIISPNSPNICDCAEKTGIGRSMKFINLGGSRCDKGCHQASYWQYPFQGKRIISCPSCGGHGSGSCSECDSVGFFECENCDGDGYKGCNNCKNSGNIVCSKCKGEGICENQKCIDCVGVLDSYLSNVGLKSGL